MKSDRKQDCFHSLFNDQKGASAVEYGLILSLVFLALMGGVAVLGDSVKERWDAIADRVAKV